MVLRKCIRNQWIITVDTILIDVISFHASYICILHVTGFFLAINTLKVLKADKILKQMVCWCSYHVMQDIQSVKDIECCNVIGMLLC